MLAEAGATAKMIVAVLGHATLAEAQRYCDEADQAGLAQDAVSLLEGHKANRVTQTAPVSLGSAKTERKINVLDSVVALPTGFKPVFQPPRPRFRALGASSSSGKVVVSSAAAHSDAEKRMVRTAGLEPAFPFEKQIFVPLRLSPPPSWRSWSGLSLRRGLSTVGAARLVSTPSPEGAWLGIGLG